jgi:Right handed beta helix region
MNRSYITYIVAAIVSFAAIGGMFLTPVTVVAQGQQQQVPAQGQQQQEPAVSQAPPQATVACGQVVTGEVRLTANLNCDGDGLIVGDDGTTINLNGFGIYGPGADSSKVGIGVSEDNVQIMGPGIISGFQAGILATGAKQLTISSAILTDNQIAAFFTGADMATVSENIIKNNNIAVASHSASGLNIESNLMSSNALAGVTFVNTDESMVNSNNVEGSQNALFLDSQSTEDTVQLNNAHENVVDMNNANGLAPNVNQNTFADNNCQVSNPSGLCFGR